MPVIKTPIQVRDNRQISPVQSPRSQMGALLDNQTAYYANKAAQYGRMFVAEGEEFAEQMVREAVFSEDENGVPQLPPEKRKWMGTAVQKTYDARMAEAMTLRLRSSIRNKINEAKNANIGDFEGFQKQADLSATAMISTLPNEFRGAFQNLWTAEIVDAGGSVGREQALIEREYARADFNQHFEEQLSSIALLYEQGPTSHHAAESMFTWMLGEIVNAPQTLYSGAEKNQLIEDLVFRVGKSRMLTDFKLRGRSVSFLTRFAAALRNPNSPEYGEFAKYFTEFSQVAARQEIEEISPWVNPTQGYDGELFKTLNLESANKFASQVINELIPLARQRELDADAQAEAAQNLSDILSGVKANDRNSISQKDRIQLNEHLARGAGLESLSWTDWVFGNTEKLSEQKISDIMMTVKTAGFLPTSLQQAFTRLNTVQDEDEFMNTYDVYVRLRDQANVMGNTKDLASLIPEDALLRLEMAELLLAKGATNDNTLIQVNEMMDRWVEMERQDPEWANAHVEFAMAMERENYGNYFGSDNDVFNLLRANPKNTDAILKDFLADELGMGENTNVNELNEGLELFKKYFRLQKGASEKPFETSLEFARKTLTGRYYHNSKYFPDGVSSKSAPELIYSDPMPTTITAAMGVFWKKYVSAGVREAGESLFYGSWWKPYADNTEFKEFNFGAALARASIFDIIVDQKINEIMENTDLSERAKLALPYKKNEDGTYTKKRNGFYEAGVHYHLEPTSGRGGIPTYNILMIMGGMDNERVQVIARDVSFEEDFKRITGEVNTYDQVLRYARAKDVLFSDLYGDGLKNKIAKLGYRSAEIMNDLFISGAGALGYEFNSNQNISNMRTAIDILADSYREDDR